LLKIKRKSVSI